MNDSAEKNRHEFAMSVTTVRFNAILGRICRSVMSQNKKDNNSSVHSDGTASSQILKTTHYS